MIKKNRNIKKFNISGVIKGDEDIQGTRKKFEQFLVKEMRLKGYVPVLDMEPQFSLHYYEHKDQFGFDIIIFGIYLGKLKAKEIEGFSGQTFLAR
jgi:hypothetical protein